MFESKKALIVVRTYPTPAKKGLEVSCTAAISDEGEWLRLFPVPYRFLDGEKKFHKYQWIDVEVEKSSSDRRRESYKIRPQSICILGDPLPREDGWKARKQIIEPLRAHCLCCLKQERFKYGFPTLGLIRPKRIERLVLTPQSAEWNEAQLAILGQGHLFEDAPAKEL